MTCLDAIGALRLDPAGLLRLLSWLSPSFPVGGFSYSHGIETAVERGLLAEAAAVEGWIAGIIGHGAGWIDAVLFLAAHRAVAEPDAEPDLVSVAELAAAMRATAETATESRSQGQAFLAAIRAAWPNPVFARCALGPAPSYAVAVAAATAAAGIDAEPALAAYLQALAATLVSAAVRLVPLGQTDGQRILAGLAARIPAIVVRARCASLDDLGSSTPLVEWTSMQHETQYTRLFRS
jgi:urease accessory protein